MVFPDPMDPDVIEAFKRGVFSEFERYSRVGMVTEDGFVDRVQELRNAGAKHVFLKTGAYRPADLARMNQVRIKGKDRPPHSGRCGRRHRHKPVEDDERMRNAPGQDLFTAIPVRRQTCEYGRVRA